LFLGNRTFTSYCKKKKRTNQNERRAGKKLRGKKMKGKEDRASVLPQEVKNSVHFCPPHPSHETNFVTHCITLTEIKLSNLGFISRASIRTGKCRQQF